MIDFADAMSQSYTHWTGRNIIFPEAEGYALAERLYHAPFVLLSHDGKIDPMFRYANLSAQRLWSRSWDDFTLLPSRLSADAHEREERQRLLDKVNEKGYVDDYQGIRVTSDGKRFKIRRCTVWNVMDMRNRVIGQAAMFDRWEWIRDEGI
jgi:hypothetical protein